MFCTCCCDSRTPVRCRNEGRPTHGLYDQTAENLGKGLFAHELLHLGDGNKGFLENVGVSGCVSGFDHGILIGVFAVCTAFHQLVAGPFFSMVDRRILGIGDDLVCPFSEVIQLDENVADLRIGKQRWPGKLVFGKLELGISSGSALDVVS